MGCTGTGTAAHTSGNEDHVSTFHAFCQYVFGFFCRFFPYFRVGPCTQASGFVLTDLDLGGGAGFFQLLRIAVHSDEFHTLESGLDHAVHGVVAAAAHTDDLDFFQGLIHRIFVCLKHVSWSSSSIV